MHYDRNKGPTYNYVEGGDKKRILFVTKLRYAGKRIVNIMKVYIERNNLQLESIRYSKNILTLFTFTLANGRIRPPIAYQEVSNTNNFGSVSDSLTAATECMASFINVVSS